MLILVVKSALSLVCWKDVSTTIAGKDFWNAFRDWSKYVMPLLKQSVQLPNQVFILVVDCFYHFVFIKKLERDLKDLVEKEVIYK